MKNKKLYKKNIKINGEKSQIIKCIEELSELTKELAKVAFNSKFETNIDIIKKISEEIADVKITLKQIGIIFDNKKEIKRAKKYKLKRLKERVKKNGK